MALDAQEMEFLRFQRAQLSEVVLGPLQRLKTTIGRSLQQQELLHIKSLLTREINNDTLQMVTDGAALVAVLDIYYGRDNLRFIERLLSKANCQDLIEIIQDWKNTSNSLNPSLFEEFGYFPLWIRVKGTFQEFSTQRRKILDTLKDVFAIPAIDIDDPYLDPLVYMGVSLGRKDVLFCVLVPECVRQLIKSSLQYSEVVAMLEESSINGIYFSRRKRAGSNRNLNSSRSSLSSANDSVFSDFGDLGDPVFEGPEKSCNTNGYNKAARPTTYFRFDKQHINSLVGQVNEKHHPDEFADDMYYKENIDGNHNNGLIYRLQEKQRSEISHVDYKYGTEAIESLDIFPGPKLVTATYGVVESLETDSPGNLDKPKSKSYGSCFFIDYRNANKVHQQSLGKADTSDSSWTPKESLDIPKEAEKPYETVQPSSGYAEESRFHMTENQSTFETSPMVEEPRSGVVQDNSLQRHGYSDFTSKVPQPEPEVWYNAAPMGTARGYQDRDSRVGYRPPSSDPEVQNVTRPYAPPPKQEVWHNAAPMRVALGYQDRDSQSKYRPPSPDPEVQNVTRTPYVPQPEREVWYSAEPQSTAHSYQDRDSRSEYRHPSPDPEVQNLTRKPYVPQPEPEIWHSAAPQSTALGYQDRDSRSQYRPPSPDPDVQNVTRKPYEYFRHSSNDMDSPPPPRRFTGEITLGRGNQGGHSPKQLPSYREREENHVTPSLYMQYQGQRVYVQEGNPQQSIIFMQDDTELQSDPQTDTEDAVFSDGGPRRLDSQGERGSVKFDISPPPYNPPPGYEDSLKRKSMMSLSMSSLDSKASRGHGGRLLSAQSVNSIYREKEMFLSSDELNESLKFAEEREWEKFFERTRDLLGAAKTGDEHEIKLLIDEGADINYQNEFGHTALMIASREGHLRVVEMLMAANADPNLQEKYGKSALHEAAWSGQHQVLHCLISGDANINITDEEKRTPLQYATLRGKKRVVDILLLFGADVSLKNMVGESAVEIAYWCGHTEILHLLLTSRDKKARKEMKGQIRKQKIKRIKSATSLPNLNKSVSLKDLSRSRSRPNLNKKGVCVIQ